MSNSVAIINGNILTMGPQGIIERGTIAIENGKIIKVGEKVRVPKDSEVFDADGLVVVPGLIDAHTHLGVIPMKSGYSRTAEANESTNPVTPEIRALDGLNPNDPAFKTAIRGGITSAMILPGSPSGPGEKLNVIAGQGITVKCVGRVADEMVLRNPACMKMALGDRPKKTFSPSSDKLKMPSTRMGVVALIRNNLTKAKYYREKLVAAKGDPSKEPDRNLGMEALMALLKKDYPARVHAYRADDIFTAIRLAEEFGFDLIIDHGVESQFIVEDLAKRQIPVVLGPLMHGKSMSELEKLSPRTPSILLRNGVKIAITTDHPARPIEYLNYHAAIAARNGLDWMEALKAITIYPAEIMGVANKIGSIEVGKDADIAIFDDNPLEPLSHVEAVYVDGTKVYPV